MKFKKDDLVILKHLTQKKEVLYEKLYEVQNVNKEGISLQFIEDLSLFNSSWESLNYGIGRGDPTFWTFEEINHGFGGVYKFKNIGKKELYPEYFI